MVIQSGLGEIICAMSTRFQERVPLPIEVGDAIGAASSTPERSLLDAIAAGELDGHLTAIADAVHARQHLIRTVRSATALAELCIGDIVRFNHSVSPQYLRGAYATVVAIDDRMAIVELQRPIGRFGGGQIRCAALALDRVPRTH